MEEAVRRKYEARAKIVKAMAHPSRLFIIDALSKKETCVCKLAELIGADVSTVSRHLSVLENAGIIEHRKQGLKVFYRLKSRCAVNIFDCVESVINNNVRQQLRAIR